MSCNNVWPSNEDVCCPASIKLPSEAVSISDKETQGVALAVFLGLLALGICGATLLYYFAANRKFSPIEASGQKGVITISKASAQFSGTLSSATNTFLSQGLTYTASLLAFRQAAANLNPFNIRIEKRQPIRNGFGEFLVYKVSPGGLRQSLSEHDYGTAFKILLKYAPGNIFSNRENRYAHEMFKRRDMLIKWELKRIDPSIEITFIPRVLYELIFLEECIKEDLAAGSICDAASPSVHKVLSGTNPDVYLDSLRKIYREKLSRRRQCWHICCFESAGDDRNEGIKKLAHRINQVAIGKLGSKIGMLTYHEICGLVEEEIAYFTNYHQLCHNKEKRGNIGVASASFPGPTTNFGYEWLHEHTRPMGIRGREHPEDALLVRNTAALECSEVARRNFLLYRGSCFKQDRPVKDGSCYSLSYGSSLFAGAIFDGGATAFYYFRQEKNDAFVLTIPFSELKTAPFYIPLTHPLCQLSGHGETFHARSKIWRGATRYGGFKQLHGSTSHLNSNQDRNALISSFERYYAENAMSLI